MFRSSCRVQSVLVDSPVSLSGSQGVISLDPSVPDSPFPSSSFSSATSSSASAPARGRRAAAGGGGGVGKKGRKKKDPNEPVKPVSAYALFFRDTQAAIKGQNPNAAFGEVSRIVASMWDSLGEEQKQVGGARAQDGRRVASTFLSSLFYWCIYCRRLEVITNKGFLLCGIHIHVGFTVLNPFLMLK